MGSDLLMSELGVISVIVGTIAAIVAIFFLCWSLGVF